MDIRTKVICTLGPSVCSFEHVRRLIEGGMNVARLNFSHGNRDEHIQWIDWIKEARTLLKKPCAILADTKGNEIRIKNLPKDRIKVEKGDTFTICVNPSGNKQFSLTSFHLVTNVQVGARIVFGDGELFGHFVDVSEGLLIVEMQVNGTLRANTSCNIVGAKINFPIIAKQDVEDIVFACRQNVDGIAASFISSPESVMVIRKLLKKEKTEDIYIISKIENKEGIDRIDSIIQVSDGIMIARGDLGVDLGTDIGKIPHIQKTIIKKAMAAGKIVIVATQFLGSMTKNRLPTRAEVSDVANAVYDGVSTVMMSEETAAGEYPFIALKTMRSIVRQAESEFDYKKFIYLHDGFKHHISSSVALAAVKTAYTSRAKAIFVSTSSGFMARLVAKFRPKTAVLALTDSEKTYNKISLIWGIHPVFVYASSQDTSLDVLKEYALQKNIVSSGDIVVVTAGSIFGKKGSTNMLIVDSIGKVTLRAHSGFGETVKGRAKFFAFDDEIDPESIIIIPCCSPEDTVMMQEAKGVIVANHPRDVESYTNAIAIAKEHNISVVCNAEEAFDLLIDGEEITINPSNGHIYKEEDV